MAVRHPPVTLGIDVGSTHLKVVAVDGGDPTRGLAVHRVTTPTHAESLIDRVFELIRETAAALGGRVGSIGIASMAETGVPLDRHDQPLSPLLRWQDTVSAPSSLAARLGASSLFSATGVRPGPKPPLAMWERLRQHQPELIEAMARWAGVADWIHLNLTGRLRTDHTLAGRTMAYRLPPLSGRLPDAFDEGLLAEVGLGGHQLPTVGLPGDPPDRLSSAAAQHLGLASGIPVVVAGHDHQVGAWAAGVRQRGQTADSIGTAEAVLSLGTATDPDDLLANGSSLVRTIDNQPAILSGTASGGAFVAWAARQWAGGSIDQLLSREGDWGGERALLPYVQGRQSPAPDPDARVGWVNLNSATSATAPSLVTAAQVIEAVNYHAAWMVQRHHSLLGHDGDEPVTALGSPVQTSGDWALTKASMAGTPVTVCRADEPVAVGAALLALVRSDQALPTTTLASTPVAADPHRRQLYQQRLPRFIEAARTTRPETPQEKA